VHTVILSAATIDGAVHIAQISLPGGSEMPLVIARSRELLPRQRIPVTKLVWSQHYNPVLAIARNGSLTLSVHDRNGYLSSDIVTCRGQNYSPVVGTPHLNILTRYNLLTQYFTRLATLTYNFLPILRK